MAGIQKYGERDGPFYRISIIENIYEEDKKVRIFLIRKRMGSNCREVEVFELLSVNTFR